MKKYLILLLVPAMFACNQGGEKKTALADSLKLANEQIKVELADKETLLDSKEAAMTEFVQSFNEIQANLNEIKDKQKIITASSTGSDLKTSSKDQILKDIQTIYDLLDKNKKRAVALAKKLKDSNVQMDEVQLAVANLKSQLTDKETEIEKLKDNLETLNVDFANLKVRYVDEMFESDKKTALINTGYYVVGSKHDLTERGLITKTGGFIGIGKVAKLNSTLDANYFTKIDVTQITEIPIHGDFVKLVSTHPTDSYKLVEGSASIDKIVILNPEKFWSVSKYLIITSEKKGRHKK